MRHFLKEWKAERRLSWKPFLSEAWRQRTNKGTGTCSILCVLFRALQVKQPRGRGAAQESVDCWLGGWRVPKGKIFLLVAASGDIGGHFCSSWEYLLCGKQKISEHSQKSAMASSSVTTVSKTHTSEPRRAATLADVCDCSFRTPLCEVASFLILATG